jgi:hypothetical protein
MKMRLASIVASGILALAASATRSFADSVAFTPVDGGFSTNIYPVGNDGFFFTPTVDIAVTSLGYYVDGLAHSNDVGIYQVSNQSLLVSTIVIVPATTDNIPTDNPPVFVYAPIAQTVLTAGVEYAVVGNEETGLAGEYITASGNVNAASGITFNGYAYNYDTSLDFPTNSYDPGYFGPNFTFTSPDGGSAPSAVPLPASLYSGSGLLALLLAAKIRSRKIAAA